jgi:hypothetical protein
MPSAAPAGRSAQPSGEAAGASASPQRAVGHPRPAQLVKNPCYWPGVDVMITIFCDFRQFSAKKIAFFSTTNVMIKILHNLALFRVKNANFFITPVPSRNWESVKNSLFRDVVNPFRRCCEVDFWNQSYDHCLQLKYRYCTHYVGSVVCLLHMEYKYFVWETHQAIFVLEVWRILQLRYCNLLS